MDLALLYGIFGWTSLQLVIGVSAASVVFIYVFSIGAAGFHNTLIRDLRWPKAD